eukprot:247394_1
MSMFIFSLSLTISIIAHCEAAHSNQRVKSIGFATSTNGVSATNGNVILTLFYDQAIYRCSIDGPGIGQDYSCNSEEIIFIGMNCDSINTQMLIDNSATHDGVVIDSVYFETTDNILHTADDFCYNQNLATGQWIDYNIMLSNGGCSVTGYDRYSGLC